MTKELSKSANKVFNAIKQHLSQFTGENAGYSDLYAADIAKKLKMDGDEVNTVLEELKEHDLVVDGGDEYGKEYAGVIYLKETKKEEEPKKEEPKANNNKKQEKGAMTTKKEQPKTDKTPAKETPAKQEPKKEQKKEEPKKATIGKKGAKKGNLLIKKAELAKKMQEHFDGSVDLFQNIIGKLVDVIREELMAGNKVKVAGLGTFKVRHLAPRTVWNPIKNESHEVGASARLVFSVENGLKQYFNTSLK